ncbi:WXG100 family type VII secretion target [Nonomuraea sp. NPDC004354]
MSYGEGKGLYYAAAATASGAALLIRRPWAYYVVLMIGLMVSDPGRMSSSAKNWRTTDHGGLTSELTALEGQLKELQAALSGPGVKWEGAAREQFDQAYNDFTQSLATLKSTRNATGEAVDQSAKLYYYGAITFMGIASFMMMYALAMIAIQRYVPFAYALDLKVGKVAVEAGKKVLLKHGIAVGLLTTLLYQAVQQSEASGKAFPTMKGIPNQLTNLKSGAMPEFSSSALDYDVAGGTLTPKLDTKGGLGGL